MNDPARWAILGAGEISSFFATSLTHAHEGVLHAVGSRDAARARAFADDFGAPIAGTYDDILARDDIDAVYIGTVHSTHVELALNALDAGKAVLCEKPIGMSAAETTLAFARAREVGLPFVEAFKYRFGPFPERLRELIVSGALGELTEITATLGSRVVGGAPRLFDPAAGGGVILDVGCYPASLAVGLAAWVGALDDIRLTDAEGLIGDTGVDVHATASITFGDTVARVACSFVEPLSRAVTIAGTRGRLEIPNVWGSRGESTDEATVFWADGDSDQICTDTVDPMAAEGDATIRALRAGRCEAPEMPWEQSLATARLLDEWLAVVTP